MDATKQDVLLLVTILFKCSFKKYINVRWYFAANTNTTPQTEKPQKERGKIQFCVVCRFYVKDEVRLDITLDLFLLGFVNVLVSLIGFEILFPIFKSSVFKTLNLP